MLHVCQSATLLTVYKCVYKSKQVVDPVASYAQIYAFNVNNAF
jgi:hypothetical protein